MTNTVTFPTSLGGDGLTYTDDDDASTGLDGGGWRTRFVPALSGAVAMGNSAAASAISAINAPGTNATSTTPNAIVSTGTISLTLAQTGKAFAVGQYVVVADTAAPATNYMIGQISAFNAGTGAMSVAVSASGGSGTPANTTISLTAKPAASTEAIGDVKLATTAPTGWLPCEGAVYTKATYAALATLLGSIPGDYTWTARTVTGISSLSFVNYAGGLYVAAGDSAGNVSTSPDGVTWTSRTANLGANLPSSYAYFNSLHIVSANGGMISTSPTGVTWTARTSNCGTGIVQLCAGTSRLVAFLQSSTTVSSSADGLTYTARTMPVSISKMAFGNGIFVAAGNATIATSPDGDTWTARTAPDSGNYSVLVFLNGYFYLAYLTSNQVTAFRSADGITWTAIPLLSPATPASPSIYVQNGAFLWNIKGVLYRSLDFSNWEAQTTVTPLGVASTGAVKYGGGLALLANGAAFYTSPEYDFTTATQFRTPDLRAKVPQALQGKAKFYMKAA